ncbi:MAG: ABC transporter ATP-binding protein [Bacteroidetes bacterium]|nr:ABC transporter ATP-binding protein [Bacteroidota bacterium]
MSDIVIKVENLGKQYHLGQVGTGTLSHDLNRFWHRVRGKEDPYLKVGELNDRTVKGEGDIVWALNEINFEVKHGDVLGIIGKNGAGKSTLLKILSQITAPTKGSIKVKGRIAALLEVGTGFHPELTGRENIFLNGAILGMTKSEIKNKFDEIVDFSGVERYIDTPVKRYSSGMMVRLGFAVAAHLEPEILIVDEVLAVGDVTFQNKCLGKMGEVSKQGRTILFVSHQMASLNQLCTRGLLLENGVSTYDGTISEAVKRYLSNSIRSSGPVFDLSSVEERKGTALARFSKLEIFNKGELSNVFVIGDDMELRLTIVAPVPIKENVNIAIHISRYDETILSNIENIDSNYFINGLGYETVIRIKFKHLNFYPETYKLGFWLANSSRLAMDHIINCAEFRIIEGSSLVRRELYKSKGTIYLTPDWEAV